MNALSQSQGFLQIKAGTILHVDYATPNPIFKVQISSVPRRNAPALK